MRARHHRRHGQFLVCLEPNHTIVNCEKLATVHAIVENQLALDDQIIVRSTLNRLMEDGLTRHEAIHAIGSVLIEHIYDVLHTESAAPDAHAPYYAALQQLTAEKWRDG